MIELKRNDQDPHGQKKWKKVVIYEIFRGLKRFNNLKFILKIFWTI